MKKALLILVLLAGFGLVKVPAEHRLFAVQRDAGFQMATVGVHVRSQLGQTGFIAALSGFRAVMADLLWIRAGTAFERTEWSRMELLLHAATQLQPRAIVFWEMAHFHMAYDAATAMQLDKKHQPVAALRRKAEREFLKIGEDFLLSGLGFNPESALLWQRLGEFYSRRVHDPEKASHAYAESARRPGAMGFVRRMAAYELAKIPGREAEAYAALKALYLESERERLPNLLRLLDELAQKLAVPTAERVYIPQSAPEAREPQRP